MNGAGGGARVGFVVSSRTFGGAEFYVEQILTHLPEDLQPVLVGAGGIPDRLRRAALSAGIEVTDSVDIDGKLDLAGQWALRRTVRRAGLDLAHVNATMATNNRWALAAALAANLPVVVTLHLRHEVVPGAQRAILRRAYSRVAMAVAVSADVAGQLEHELGIPATRVRVIANGVDPRAAGAVVTAPGGGPVRIGAVGRLETQKGFDVLIDAVGRLVGSGRSVELAIGGEGPDEALLRSRAQGLPVSFAGVVDVPAFVAGLDVFCLPSRWEGLPFVLLQAMMGARPAVVTAVGDVPDAVGETALVVPPGDAGRLAEALDRLVTDPGERRRLGEAAAKRARQRYSSARMVAETVGIYREVLAR